MPQPRPSRGVDLNQRSLMVTDVCWNPPRGADVLGQELVVLIKAPCPSVPAQDLALHRDRVCQGGDSAVGVPGEKISRSSPLSAPSHGRTILVQLTWLVLMRIG